MTGNDQLSSWTEKMLQITSQSQTSTKKWSWLTFGVLVLVWYTTAFWIPAKPAHLRSRLSKSVRYTENCHACSWHWLTERAKFFSATMPDCTSHNQCFKSWTNWVTKFCLCHIQLTSRQPTDKILQASWQLFFAEKKLTQPARSRQSFSRVCQIPKYRFLRYRNKWTYFSLAKMFGW